jgi:hypothetical protein
MARGSKIPLEVHYIVIRLSSIMKPDDIAIYTGISPRAVKRILQYFAMHGRVEGVKEHKRRGGTLRDTDLQVSYSAIIFVILPDWYQVSLWSHSTEPRSVPR